MTLPTSEADPEYEDVEITDNEGGKSDFVHTVILRCFMTIQPHLSTGAPSNDDIPVERNPVYSAGLQPPTAATGGDGVVVLENPAYSVPTDLQPPPGPQPPTAATDDEEQTSSC